MGITEVDPLIMVAVFSGFILGSDPVVKMMGVGLATVIFLDATVVRLMHVRPPRSFSAT